MLRLGPVIAVFVALLAACGERVPDARDCDPKNPWRPLCGLMNPEDVVPLPGTPWVLASELRRPGNPPGSIVAFTLGGDKAVTVVGPSHPAERVNDPILAQNAEICPGPLPPDGLAPHGMDLIVEDKPPWILLVVNHGTRESIEMYDVTPVFGPPMVRWMGCIPLPDGFAGDDVAARPEGALVVSATRSTGLGYWLTFAKVALGLPVGDVIEWSHDTSWQHLDGTAVGLPNGVALRGENQVFVADWAGSHLVRVDRKTGRRDEVALPHHPDNLSWTADGRLLVAGQIGSIRTAMSCLDGSVRNCGQAWSVLSIDPDTLAVTPIVAGDGRDFGAASAAVLDGDTLVVGTWAGDRVLRLAATKR